MIDRAPDQVLDAAAQAAPAMPTPAQEVIAPKSARDFAERIAACWRQSVESVIEAGRLLVEAKAQLEHGEFGKMIQAELPFGPSTAERLMKIAGDRRLTDPAHVQHLPPHWGTLYELTKLSDDEFNKGIEARAINPGMERKVLINGARSLMGSRLEPSDSLDFFPTPPWATRALIERVLKKIGVKKFRSAAEPACGEGHMAEVLAEYFKTVHASDIRNYGYAGTKVRDFLKSKKKPPKVDWVITNPPFGGQPDDDTEPGRAGVTERFILKALQHARVGVAMFVRLQVLEGVGRCERIYQKHPPAVVAFFAERVNLCKGLWDPNGGTATAYIWLVWVKRKRPMAPFWIPPGQREGMTRPGDVERFTQHPVARRTRRELVLDARIATVSRKKIADAIFRGGEDKPKPAPKYEPKHTIADLKAKYAKPAKPSRKKKRAA